MAYRLTVSAQRDLAEISRYTMQQWGKAQTLKYSEQLAQALLRIAVDPLLPISRARSDVMDGCRALAVGKHLIFYQQQASDMVILRLLHQRMLMTMERMQ